MRQGLQPQIWNEGPVSNDVAILRMLELSKNAEVLWNASAWRLVVTRYNRSFLLSRWVPGSTAQRFESHDCQLKEALIQWFDNVVWPAWMVFCQTAAAIVLEEAVRALPLIMLTQVSCERDTGSPTPAPRTPARRSWRCRDSAPCDVARPSETSRVGENNCRQSRGTPANGCSASSARQGTPRASGRAVGTVDKGPADAATPCILGSETNPGQDGLHSGTYASHIM